MDVSEEIVRKKFKEYYSKNWTRAPKGIATREFGFGSWDKKIESRHFSFMNEKGLNGYLMRNAPLYISYSAAHYKFPSARPIEKKEWQGAELIFDIDTSELGIPCIEKHGKGFICEKCISLAKENAERLVEEFLMDDFGAEEEDLEVNFSGNRGFHCHFVNFENIGGYARREIADYVNGKGIDYENIFEKLERREIGPKPSDGGWKGKFARRFLKLLEERKLERFIGPKIALKFYKKEVEKELEVGNWEKIYISERKKIFDQLIEKIINEISCKIDESVTIDTTKIIRLPDSLHGESGLKAKRIAFRELKRFDLKSAIVFGREPIKVYIKECPEFFLSETFGPYKDQFVELPEFVAIYLLCKKVATFQID